MELVKKRTHPPIVKFQLFWLLSCAILLLTFELFKMAEYNLSYREVIPIQTSLDSWKEITLNTGNEPSNFTKRGF